MLRDILNFTSHIPALNPGIENSYGIEPEPNPTQIMPKPTVFMGALCHRIYDEAIPPI